MELFKDTDDELLDELLDEHDLSVFINSSNSFSFSSHMSLEP
jgi:hypothetical protein